MQADLTQEPAGELLVEPRAGQTVVDLAYDRDGAETALVAAARAAGCAVVDGLEANVRASEPIR